MSTIRAQRYKKIIENRPFFTKKLSIIFFKEKGQRAPLPSYIRHHPSSILLLTSDIILQTSDILLLTSDIFHLTSSIRHLFRTTPVPFNLEGAPPLSCILPPQEEENRSACRSYIKVSADHQRSGFFCALRQGQRQSSASAGESKGAVNDNFHTSKDSTNRRALMTRSV